jgi:divalent metal cation (Fe/Co/Zn/Cd) transporter
METNNKNLKFKVQRIIAISSFLIFIGKLIAYFLTNSVGILTDALESTVNVINRIYYFIRCLYFIKT